MSNSAKNHSDELSLDQEEVELTREETANVNAEILHQLKLRLGIKTDSALAEKLGCHKSFITLIRTGRKHLPISVKLKMLDTIGYLAARDVLLSLTTLGFAKKLRQLDLDRLKLSLHSEEQAHEQDLNQNLAELIHRFGPGSVEEALKIQLVRYRAANQQASSAH